MTQSPFDPAALTGLLDGEQAGTRERVRRLLASPEFAVLSEPGREAYRAQVLSWCRRLAAEGIGALGLPREQGGGGDPAAFLAAFETIAHHDLSLLVGGRVSVALASVAVAKSALCIAVRYAGRRRQFGAPEEPETLLLDYPAHQRRLLPRLATTYALHFALRDLAARYVETQAKDHVNDEDSRKIEGLAAGMEPAQVMLECQTHLLATARAHVDRVVVERAAAAVAETGGVPAGLAAVLHPLLALHALSRLEADAGWLLEHGVLEAAKARAIRKEIDALCRELRPAAQGLVDAFAIPDALLAAPIAV